MLVFIRLSPPSPNHTITVDCSKSRNVAATLETRFQLVPLLYQVSSAPGLIGAMIASKPPDETLWMSLPEIKEVKASAGLVKLWYEYVLYLEHPTLPRLVYVGSCIHARGIGGCIWRYEEGSRLPAKVVEALLRGYVVTYHGVLSTTPKPNSTRIDVTRIFMWAKEAYLRHDLKE